MEYSELFIYNEGELFHKLSRGSRKTGDCVGNTHTSGYKRTRINNREVKIHTVVWEMFNGTIPKGFEVDHINHRKGDNRIENLRLVTRAENQRNQPKRRTNTSGVTGVRFCRNRTKWISQIQVDGKAMNLGRYDNKFDAACARKSAENKFKFHPNHGK